MFPCSFGMSNLLISSKIRLVDAEEAFFSFLFSSEIWMVEEEKEEEAAVVVVVGRIDVPMKLWDELSIDF